MTEIAQRLESQRDMVRKPVSALLWWCLPTAAGVAAGALRAPLNVNAVVWAVAFLWMGAGCFLNAQRCHRLHCYFSGPVFIAGAAVAAAVSDGLGSRSLLSYDVATTFALVGMTFVPEFVWRKYV
jgi:hypothetical protein